MNRFDTEENKKSEENKVCVECINVNSIAGSTQNDKNLYTEYKQMHYKNTMPDSRILVFLTGFCIGMVFFYLLRGNNTTPFDKEQLMWLQNINLNYTGLLEYIFGLRFGQLAFCAICALSTLGGVLAYLIMGWYGFELGVIIFSLVYQYGMKGIFLTISMFVPQGIFYVIAFLLIFHKCWNSNGKYYHKEETITKKGRLDKLNKIKKPAIILCVFGMGVLCEVYINPILVKKIALFF